MTCGAGMNSGGRCLTDARVRTSPGAKDLRFPGEEIVSLSDAVSRIPATIANPSGGLQSTRHAGTKVPATKSATIYPRRLRRAPETRVLPWISRYWGRNGSQPGIRVPLHSDGGKARGTVPYFRSDAYLASRVCGRKWDSPRPVNGYHEVSAERGWVVPGHQCRHFEFTFKRDPRAGENFWILSIVADSDVTSECPDVEVKVSGDDGDKFSVLVSVPCDSTGSPLLDGSGEYQHLAFQNGRNGTPGRTCQACRLSGKHGRHEVEIVAVFEHAVL